MKSLTKRLAIGAVLLQRPVHMTAEQVLAAARTHLAEIGYDPKMGARPFERLFEDRIKRPLAHEILFGKLTDGGTVTVDMVGDQLQVVSAPVLSDLVVTHD